MERRSIVLIVAVGAALALPARAYAVDHLVLDISPMRVAPAVTAKATKQERARVKALAPWRLHGRVVGRNFYRFGDPEIFGVTLSRSFPAGRGDELHAFRAAPKQTMTFDGQRGRWEARFGNALTLRMEIEATGAQESTDPPLPCLGTFSRVPVTLRGTFVLRTGTKFFRDSPSDHVDRPDDLRSARACRLHAGRSRVCLRPLDHPLTVPSAVGHFRRRVAHVARRERLDDAQRC